RHRRAPGLQPRGADHRLPRQQSRTRQARPPSQPAGGASMRTTRWIATGGVVLAMTVAGACAPGSDGGSGTETSKENVNTDISEVGDVTLTVWDQEVRGAQSKAMDELNAAFEKKYPNVTVERV